MITTEFGRFIAILWVGFVLFFLSGYLRLRWQVRHPLLKKPMSRSVVCEMPLRRAR